MFEDMTAIEVVWELSAELVKRGDEKQAAILRACADALYSEGADEDETPLYLDAFADMVRIAEKHGLLP